MVRAKTEPEILLVISIYEEPKSSTILSHLSIILTSQTKHTEFKERSSTYQEIEDIYCVSN